MSPILWQNSTDEGSPPCSPQMPQDIPGRVFLPFSTAISMSAPTTVCEVKDGEFLSYVITPEQFGFTRCSKDELIGGSPQDNAQIALAILKGEKGPRRDAVVLNSAAAIHIAKGISIEDAIREAQEVIDSGKALAQLEQFAALTNQE